MTTAVTQENTQAHEPKEGRGYNPVTILNLISDRHISRILMCTSNSAKSISNISELNAIPIAVCYRKVRLLEKLGFIRCIGVKKRKNGKGTKLYKSQIANAHFFLEKGIYRARVQFSEGDIVDYGGTWSLINELPSQTL